jgi:putative oxygen-independent coproporphyrinogen III oxidase
LPEVRRSLTGGRGTKPILGGSQAAGAGLTYLPYRPKPAAPQKPRAFQKAGDNKAFDFQVFFSINIHNQYQQVEPFFIFFKKIRQDRQRLCSWARARDRPRTQAGAGGRVEGNKTMNASASAGLYVHVPFCQGKCPYCDFASGTDLSRIPAWLAALAIEMALYRDLALHFDTLYFGGGTPSLLATSDLAALLEGLFGHFALAEETEITLEANPDDLTPQVLRNYRDLGVNRLSLGVQSLDDRELAFLGRRHDAAQALAALAGARDAGFAALGVDLIYGLPGQSLDAWRRTLEKILDFSPEHLSCYQLTLAEGTPLARRQAAGQFQALGEEEQRGFFLFTSQFLEDRGYNHYEISNFARGPQNRSRHNSRYWDHSPYLGLGPAAHSFVDGRRWWNHRSVADYCRALTAGQAPVAGQEELTGDQRRLEAVFLGMRTQNGIPLALVQHTPEEEAAVREVVRAGLAEIKGDRLTPTREGLVVADRLPLWLLT